MGHEGAALVEMLRPEETPPDYFVWKFAFQLHEHSVDENVSIHLKPSWASLPVHDGYIGLSKLPDPILIKYQSLKFNYDGTTTQNRNPYNERPKNNGKNSSNNKTDTDSQVSSNYILIFRDWKR